MSRALSLLPQLLLSPASQPSALAQALARTDLPLFRLLLSPALPSPMSPARSLTAALPSLSPVLALSPLSRPLALLLSRAPPSLESLSPRDTPSPRPVLLSLSLLVLPTARVLLTPSLRPSELLAVATRPPLVPLVPLEVTLNPRELLAPLAVPDPFLRRLPTLHRPTLVPPRATSPVPLVCSLSLVLSSPWLRFLKHTHSIPTAV